MGGSRTAFGAVFGWAILAGLWMAPAFPFLTPEAARAQDQTEVGVPDAGTAVDQTDAENPPGAIPPYAPPDAEAVPAEEPPPPEPPEPAPPEEVPPPAPVFPGVTPSPGLAPGGPAGARIAVEGNLVNLDFADADIQDVVKQMSEITGKNFILDERVRGKITIISPGKVTIDEAYKVFESVLNVKGFATIPAGKFLKIVPLREAKEGNIATYPEASRVPDRDEYVTRLIPLRYVDATDISNSLKPLVSRDASMIPYAPTNTIILSDSAYNINKILDIIRQIDVVSYQETLEIIQLKYAAAKDIADEISQVFGEGQQGGAGGGGFVRRIRQMGVPGQGGQSGPKIITDDRTNSLIIMASPRQIEDIRNLIRRLDYQTGRGRIHVYYLENADAKDMAETLGSLAGGGGGGGGGARSAAQGQPGGVPAAVAATVAEMAEGVRITSDEPTNALIIESSPEAYETIKDVIEKLDIKRPQVLVEALLLEVSVGPNTLATGVTVAGGNFFDQSDPKKGGIFGNTAPSVFPPSGAASPLITGADIANVLNGTGLGASPFGALLTGFKAVNVKTPGADNIMGTADDKVIAVPVIRFAIQAAAARTDTNILSAPNILTTDNQEAEIQIGENIPIQTAAISSTSSAGTVPTTDNTLVNNSFERQDTGVILKVTPQISEGDNVRLEISNEITEVKDDGSPVGLPNLTKRSLKNVVYVADGATVVIGGIISSKLSKGSNRVPWLGDIPGLGWAFKNKSKSMRKINLIVFLTPHIVRSPEDLRRVTNFKQKEFETKSREALRQTDDEERRERETRDKARTEGKSVEEYEDKYNLNRARSPIDQALKEIKKSNMTGGAAPAGAAPRATPGRREEMIGEPESKAPSEDATGRVIVGDRGETPPAPQAPEAEPAAAPPRTASIPTGNYTVQVGAFPDRNQAERLSDKLKDKRYDVYITSGVVPGGGVVHRVRVGRFEKEAEARKAAGTLEGDLSGEETVPFVVKLAE